MSVDGKELVGCLEETLAVAPGTIRESDSLGNLEGWDSIAVVSVMATIEYTYGVALDPGKLAECQTVGDLVRLVQDSCSDS
jgi:acyl carrier protein